jgi:hypothetical protein
MSPRQEAEAIAGRVRAYWAALGQHPHVWAERQRMTASATDGRLFWVVRSDMLNGWPQPATSKAVKIVSGLIRRPTAAILVSMNPGQRPKAFESVRPSIRVWWAPAVSGAAAHPFGGVHG